MSRQRVKIGDIRVGAPLPWDAFDSEGRLLLRQGAVIQNDEQLDRLLQVGLFSDVLATSGSRPLISLATTAIERDRVSVFGLLDVARTRLASFTLPHVVPDAFREHVVELVRDLRHACELDADAALATVLLSRWMPYSVRQSCNCAIVYDALCRQLEWPPEQRLPGMAAALTMNLPIFQLQDILYHQKAPLDDAQKAAIFAHPRKAVELLASLGVHEAAWLDAVAQHHEGLDGAGYPSRLAAEAIGTEARLLGIVDKYCAMLAERAHRNGLPTDAALREMLAAHSKGMDTGLAAHLVRAVGIYPPGSAVELNNREIGVVVKRTLDARHPVVRVVFSSEGRALREFPKRLTSKAPFGVKCAVDRSRLGADFDPVPLWHDTLVAKDH